MKFKKGEFVEVYLNDNLVLCGTVAHDFHSATSLHCVLIPFPEYEIDVPIAVSLIKYSVRPYTYRGRAT